MASGRKSSTSEDKAGDSLYKLRVKELEEEVSTLKKRLDDLRRAKNTVKTKREREIVEVGTPFSKRESHLSAESATKITELKKKLEESEEYRLNEISELKKKFTLQLQNSKKQIPQELSCDHEKEIAMLKRTLAEIEADNAALIVENTDLKERVGSLMSELSVKEAKWCENEEELKLKLKWQERYKQWMEATEDKIKELEATNNILKSYLRRHNPNAPELETSPEEREPV